MISSFLRVKSLQLANFAMGICFSEKTCSFVSSNPKKKQKNNVSEIINFSKKHHFFSQEHPLIAFVTESKQDIWVVSDLLKTIYDKIPLEQQELITQETLVKVLAFRNLQEGMELLIPVRKQLLRYYVDTVFNLDRGMPAFGLVAENQTGPSLLLFRGTELSWKGRRSVVSDLDLQGVGYNLFLKSQKEINAWLKRAHEPRALGYSLGGILAAYSLLFNPKEVHSAVAFNPPGFSKKALEAWNRESLNHRLTVYVTRGDCISKYGFLKGTVKEFSFDKRVLPISAHTVFVTAEPFYYVG